MIYYIVPTLIWIIFCTWKTLQAHKELKLRDYVFALPLILISVLSGVGPDIPNYIAYAQSVIWWGGERTVDVEFGYGLLMRIVAVLTGDPRLVVAVISLMAVILFFSMLYMWENGQCAVSLILIPLFFSDFTMNILRVGIAFPLAAIAIMQLEKKRYTQFYFLALASICIQMTAVILLPLLLLARRGAKVSHKEMIYGLSTGTLILYLGYVIFGDRIAYKLMMYSINTSLGSNRGTGPLIISFVCSIIAIWFCEKRHRYLGLVFLAIQVVLFGIVQVSMAGSRLQSMELFAQLLALSYCAKRPINRGQLAVVILLCCVTFSYTARFYLLTFGEPSAFIPYHFVWESR